MLARLDIPLDSRRFLPDGPLRGRRRGAHARAQPVRARPSHVGRLPPDRAPIRPRSARRRSAQVHLPTADTPGARRHHRVQLFPAAPRDAARHRGRRGELSRHSVRALPAALHRPVDSGLRVHGHHHPVPRRRAALHARPHRRVRRAGSTTRCGGARSSWCGSGSACRMPPARPRPECRDDPVGGPSRGAAERQAAVAPAQPRAKTIGGAGRAQSARVAGGARDRGDRVARADARGRPLALGGRLRDALLDPVPALAEGGLPARARSPGGGVPRRRGRLVRGSGLALRRGLGRHGAGRVRAA